MAAPSPNDFWYRLYQARYLNETEQAYNVRRVHGFFAWPTIDNNRPWTLNAISGMLGNMYRESRFDPSIWQNINTAPPSNIQTSSRGYGLVQWTSGWKYIGWAQENYSRYGVSNGDYANGYLQCQRLLFELNGGYVQWSTNFGGLSFRNFTQSNQSPEYLAEVFMKNYEKPADTSASAVKIRADQARKWYDYLLVNPGPPDDPIDPGPGPEPSGKLSILEMAMIQKKRKPSIYLRG